jgi:hypothetical protein
MTHKKRDKSEKVYCFKVLNVLFYELEGFSCSFYVLHGGLGINIEYCSFDLPQIRGNAETRTKLESPCTDIFNSIVYLKSKYLVVGSSSSFSSVFLLRAEEVDQEDEPISEMVNLVHQPQVFLISIYSIEQCCRSVTFWYGSGSTPLTNGSGYDSESGSCYFP